MSCYDLSLAINNAHVAWRQKKNVWLSGLKSVLDNLIVFTGSSLTIGTDWATLGVGAVGAVELAEVEKEGYELQLSTLATWFNMANCWSPHWADVTTSPYPWRSGNYGGFGWTPGSLHGVGGIVCQKMDMVVSLDGGQSGTAMSVNVRGYLMN